MPEIVSPNEVLMRGLVLVGFPIPWQQTVRRSKNLERFALFFGSAPAVHARIWLDLQSADDEDAHVDKDKSGTCFEHMLMACHFLKCCPAANQSEGLFGLSDTTIRRWVWFYVGKIRALKTAKIVWPEHWNPTNAGPETTFSLAVDGTHCRIGEPKHDRCSKNQFFCSHKFKQAGLGYEMALSVFENRCIWMNGPFPAGKNDISIFRSALKGKMSAGQLGVADKGCRGECALLSMPNSSDTAEVREFKGRALARHEKFNGQIKNFGCLSGQFRHHQDGFEKHQLCFEAVVVICQHQLENGSPSMVV